VASPPSVFSNIADTRDSSCSRHEIVVSGTDAVRCHRFGCSGAHDLAPKYSILKQALTHCEFLAQRKLEFSGVWAQDGNGADEPFISDVGTLLPMALCGLSRRSAPPGLCDRRGD